MAAISDNLLHFLARQHKDSPSKQFEVFRAIIESGLRTGIVQIKYPDGANATTNAVCFTDIPLSECTAHTAIYGKFGIGFRKAYVKNAGGNPARYFVDYTPGRLTGPSQVESRGALFYNLGLQYKFMYRLRDYANANPEAGLYDRDGTEVFSSSDIQTHAALILYLFCFDKEMGDLGNARDETKEIDLYYKEREWRLVPSRLNEVSGSSKKHDESGLWYYGFCREDVNMIVVPNEEMRLTVLSYLLSLRQSQDTRARRFGEDPPPIVSFDDLHRW